MARSIGLVVPAYEPDVARLSSYVDSIRDVIPLETVRIELDAPNGSPSRSALSTVDAELNVVRTRRGKGAAITHGFNQLDTDVVAFADADGSTPPRSLRDVIDAAGEAGLSVGSRRHPAAEIVSSQDPLRTYMGDAFARLARLALDIDLCDFQCGAKALTAETWEAIRSDITQTGFAWDLEVIGMADAHGFDIAEVPIAWEDCPESTVNPAATAAELAWALLDINHRIQLRSKNSFHQLIAPVWPGSDGPGARIHTH